MKRPLRVCHVSTMTGWGGVERMLVDLLTHVPQSEIHHHLLTTSSKPEILREIRQSGIPHFEPKRRWHYDLSMVYQMALWLKEKQIDVVHSYNAFANSWGYLAAQLAKVPVFLTGEHGSVLRVSPPISWLDRWAQSHAHRVIANSQASATLLNLLYGIAPDRVAVVYNAVPPLPAADSHSLRAQLGVPNDVFLVGSVGRLDMPKHFSVLVETAVKILEQRQDIMFLLVGGGPHEQSLRQQIHRHQIANKFIMTGWRSDARAIVQTFNLFVSTSLQESFGNALVEAALAGVPAIAPAVGGIPDAVVNQETGILLRPTNSISASPNEKKKLYKKVLIEDQLVAPRALSPSLLAETIIQLLDHPQKRERMGQAAKSRAQQLFTLDRYSQELEAIYRQQVDRQAMRINVYA